jgi:hypothetical protein
MQLHTQRKNVYEVCQRCGVTWPLAEMRWQNGKLLCQPNRCLDAAIIGSRDLNVARAVAQDRHELQPDPKLTHPVDRRNDENECLY